MPTTASRKVKPALVRFKHIGPAFLSVAVLLMANAFSTVSLQEKKTQSERPQQGADDTVRLRSDLVVVSATVTDSDGHYAHGLKANDFVILEDGARQAVNSFSAEEAPFATAILIDMSGSMEYKFGLVRGAAANFTEQIRENDQVAVYGFNNKIRQFQDFTNVRDISEYIWDAKAEDQTKMYDCIDEALAALEKREEKRRAILLISDGWDTGSARASLDSVMKRALRAGVTLYTVDLIEDDALRGSATLAMYLRRGRGEMQEMAAQTGGRYVHTPQGDKLDQEFSNIIDELHNQYTLTYYSSNTKRDGRWRKIAVDSTKQGLTIRARRGYYASK